MNRLLAFCASLLLLSVVTSARALTVTQTYQFTGADLMNYVIAPGPDGSTAAGNGEFDGARLRRDGTNPDGQLARRSYWGSQNEDFTNWLETTNDRFLSFNLWGLDGRGASWGEDYKPNRWVSQDNSERDRANSGDITRWGGILR